MLMLLIEIYELLRNYFYVYVKLYLQDFSYMIFHRVYK